MFETVTVDEALSKGRKSINTPVLIIMFGLIALSVYLVTALHISGWFAAVGILFAFVIAWLYWSFAITKWRLWAFENVRNVHELKNRAVKEKLIWPDGSFWERTEIRSADEKQRLLNLQGKFNSPDIFNDDHAVTNETVVYYSKIKGLLQAIFMMGAFVMGLYLVIHEHNYILGAIIAGVGAIFTYTGFAHFSNKAPQITISNDGIQTASVPFYTWAQISGEDVITKRQGKSSTTYLVYNYPGGNLELDINELDINKSELEKLLRIYKGRGEKSAVRF